jgi:hypothetical protein
MISASTSSLMSGRFAPEAAIGGLEIRLLLYLGKQANSEIAACPKSAAMSGPRGWGHAHLVGSVPGPDQPVELQDLLLDPAQLSSVGLVFSALDLTGIFCCFD